MRRFTLPVAILAAAAIAVGCDKDLSPTGSADLPTALPFTHVPEDVCYNITFDDQGFSHGTIVTSLTSPFGFAIGVSVTNDPNGLNRARTYSTDNVGGPDFDLEWNGGSARCGPCNGQGLVLVIEEAPWADEGDSDEGGDINLTGFAGNGDFYIEEFKALDQEVDENVIQAFVDGSLIGQSSGQGDGSVETIVTTQTIFNTSAVFRLDGSGAVDDILVCRVTPPEGGEGCTPGYWKQDQHFDSWVGTGYSPGDDYETVFGVSISGSFTLLQALEANGGGLNALLRHSTAALLNAASPDVDYDLTVAEVIAMVQAAIASGDYETTKNIFEGFNEEDEGTGRFCPLN